MTPRRSTHSHRRSHHPAAPQPEVPVVSPTPVAETAARPSRWRDRHAPPEPQGERHVSLPPSQTRHTPPSGVAPSGVAPSGVAPSGVAPSGVAPSGVAPSGVAPSGVAPSGAAQHRWPKSEEEAPEEEFSNDAPWSDEEWTRIARECTARRGRKLSRRQMSRLAQRARRRHLRSEKRQQKAARPRRTTPTTPLWRHLRRLTIILLLLAVGELVIAALTSPHFAVTQVTSDETPITPAEVVSSVKSELVGQNWLRADTAPGVEKLKELPMVQDASVRRELDWPPRLHVNVIERTPFARVSSGEQWWIVDRTGIPFRLATKADQRLYAISSRVLAPQIGKPLPGEQWQTVVEFADALAEDTKQGHDWALRAIYFDQHGFASLRLADTSPAAAPGDRLLVHLGTGPWDKKLQRARESLQWFATTGRRAEVLNLVSYKFPVWTPRRQAQTPESTGVQQPA